MGHLLLACIEDPTGTSSPGAMIDPATAIRDPVFYRWHKHVDDICSDWQERQPPHDFSDAPDAVIRKGVEPNASPDVILCFKDAIPGSTDENAGRRRHALLAFLVHHPHVAGLGLRIPSLEERSPWKVLPSKEGED